MIDFKLGRFSSLLWVAKKSKHTIRSSNDYKKYKGSRIFKIGRFSFTFSKLIRSPVVIFDNAGSNVLATCVLGGISHFVFCSRQELFYIHPMLLLSFIKNILRKFDETFSLGKLYRIYLLSCIEFLKPKIVLTFVDNSFEFQWIAKYYGKGKFYAIQNGSRLPYNLTKWLPAPPHPASKICLPNFVCFGEFEKDVYNYYGHEVAHFHPTGSLRGSYYYNELRAKTIRQRFDICLISEWDHSLQNNPIFPEIGEGIDIVNDYFLRYAKTRNRKICIATRSTDQQEFDYFQKAFGERVVIIKNDRETMSTYRAIDESNVSVTAFSTAGVEAFGWGKKVLFCNFTGHDNYSFPVEDICRVSERNYEDFCRKLDFLLSMNEENFKTATNKSAKYLMNYNFDIPTHQYLQRIIRDVIGDLSPGN